MNTFFFHFFCCATRSYLRVAPCLCHPVRCYLELPLMRGLVPCFMMWSSYIDMEVSVVPRSLSSRPSLCEGSCALHLTRSSCLYGRFLLHCKVLPRGRLLCEWSCSLHLDGLFVPLCVGPYLPWVMP